MPIITITSQLPGKGAPESWRLYYINIDGRRLAVAETPESARSDALDLAQRIDGEIQ